MSGKRKASTTDPTYLPSPPPPPPPQPSQPMPLQQNPGHSGQYSDIQIRNYRPYKPNSQAQVQPRPLNQPNGLSQQSSQYQGPLPPPSPYNSAAFNSGQPLANPGSTWGPPPQYSAYNTNPEGIQPPYQPSGLSHPSSQWQGQYPPGQSPEYTPQLNQPLPNHQIQQTLGKLPYDPTRPAEIPLISDGCHPAASHYSGNQYQSNTSQPLNPPPISSQSNTQNNPVASHYSGNQYQSNTPQSATPPPISSRLHNPLFASYYSANQYQDNNQQTIFQPRAERHNYQSVVKPESENQSQLPQIPADHPTPPPSSTGNRKRTPAQPRNICQTIITTFHWCPCKIKNVTYCSHNHDDTEKLHKCVQYTEVEAAPTNRNCAGTGDHWACLARQRFWSEQKKYYDGGSFEWI